MTTQQRIAQIIDEQYSGYRGRAFKSLQKAHSLIRLAEGEEKFLDFLEKQVREHPMPKYPTYTLTTQTL